MLSEKSCRARQMARLYPLSHFEDLLPGYAIWTQQQIQAAELRRALGILDIAL